MRTFLSAALGIEDPEASFNGNWIAHHASAEFELNEYKFLPDAGRVEFDEVAVLNLQTRLLD
eukprot:6487232-Amphidinium_carterae.1